MSDDEIQQGGEAGRAVAVDSGRDGGSVMVAVRLPAGTVEELRGLADRQCNTLAGIVRLAIRRLIEEDDEPEKVTASEGGAE